MSGKTLKLFEAIGLELEYMIVNAETLNVLPIVEKILRDHKQELLKLGVRALSLFGSVAKNTASAGSDIDILVDFDAKRGLFGFMGLKNYLEELLDCDVDLVTKSALHPALKKQILHEAKDVF